MLLVGIGTTAFDGAREGPLFNGIVTDLQDGFTGLGLSKGFGLELAFVVGLLDLGRRRDRDLGARA